jgi:hypothetical protein
VYDARLDGEDSSRVYKYTRSRDARRRQDLLSLAAVRIPTCSFDIKLVLI